jgi:mono/diheme cytochrome c family protein
MLQPSALLFGSVLGFAALTSLSAPPESAPAPTPPAPVRPILVPAAAQAPAPVPSAPTFAPILPQPPAAAGPIPAPAQPIIPPHLQVVDASILKWDADSKEAKSKPGDVNVPFTFWFTNVSSGEIAIKSTRTSCGCTVAKLPQTPWNIPAGSNGPIEVTMNVQNKGGVIQKSVTVETSAGVKTLLVKVDIAPPTNAVATPAQLAAPAMGDTERLKNMQLALADRQVVFKNAECASCHAEPAKGKIDGQQLYAAVCTVCHDSLHRAALVPDLRTLKHPTGADHWRKWITYGRPGSMMPAFAKNEGGILDDQQINALVEYMVRHFPSAAQPATRSASLQTAPGVNAAGVAPTPKVN